MKIKHLFTAIALCLVAFLLFPLPAHAQIQQPTALSINSVYAYRHCLELNDQLYVGQYSVSCNTTYSLTEAFLTRLMNGAAELKAQAPYAYFNNGYGEGVFSFYFSAAEVTAKSMVWNGAYTMKLEGNPTLTWMGGVPPSVSVGTFTWSSSTGIVQTRDELGSRILYLADYLEQLWGINLVDTLSTGSYLSAYGTDYFTNVVPDLQSMVPGIFSGGTITPSWERKGYTQGYGTTLAGGAAGTPFDVSALAASLGISTMWMSTILYLLGGAVMIFFALMPMGNTRALVLLSVPLLVGGALLSMLPLILVIMLGLAAWVLSLFVLLYTPSSA